MALPALFAIIVTGLLLAAVAVFLIVVVVLLVRIVRALSAIDSTVGNIASRAQPLQGLLASLNEELCATAEIFEPASGSDAGAS
ncbi:MAG: hypothetical protein KY395_04950 [Actinobacteria bacterium]|nr:hypothetical protein [Actinomycetota bacterium]